MSVPGWLWIVFTVVAALSQTFRNALQRELTPVLGTVGATHVRFLYGLPFGILFLLVILLATGQPLPGITPTATGWVFMGAMTQIAATALLLAAMQARSFVVVTAYSKTEPVQVALFGLVLLGDHLTFGLAMAILIATVGVVLTSWPKERADFSWRPVALGLAAAGLFGLSSVGFRGGIAALQGPSFIANASTALVMSLAMQTVALTTWLGLANRPVLVSIFRSWRRSLPAGFLGAFASQGWFLAFAIESAARVRTLALVEILFAQLVSRRLFNQSTGTREWLGIGLIVVGVIWLLSA